MAKPQTEHGYTRIANELLDALIGSPLSSTQWAIVALVIRNTYGWNRKAAPFTWAGMARSINADPSNARRVGADLVRSGVLTIDREGLIGIEKDYTKWGQLAAFPANSPLHSRRTGRARSPYHRYIAAGIPGRVGPDSTVEPKDSKDSKDKKDSGTAQSFEERDRQAKLESAWAEDAMIRERTRKLMNRA